MPTRLSASCIRSDAAVLALECQRPSHFQRDSSWLRTHVSRVEHQRRWYPLRLLLVSSFCLANYYLSLLQKWKGNCKEPWWAIRASAVQAVPVCRPRRAPWLPVSLYQQPKVTAGPALLAPTMWWLVVPTIQSRCVELQTPRANLSRHRPNAPGTPLVCNFFL